MKKWVTHWSCDPELVDGIEIQRKNCGKLAIQMNLSVNTHNECDFLLRLFKGSKR